MPGETQPALVDAGGTGPSTAPTARGSVYKAAVHDYLLPFMQCYETWGRDIEIRFLTSSGTTSRPSAPTW